jgi:hypothetical protein
MKVPIRSVVCERTDEVYIRAIDLIKYFHKFGLVNIANVIQEYVDNIRKGK